MNSPRCVVAACNSSTRIFTSLVHPASNLCLTASTYHSTQASRRIHKQTLRKAATTPSTASYIQRTSPEPTNPALSFPCLDSVESRSLKLHRRSLEGGPEPSYNIGKHLTYHSYEPLLLDWGGVLPEFSVA